jgi:hypothetical protein
VLAGGRLKGNANRLERLMDTAQSAAQFEPM